MWPNILEDRFELRSMLGWMCFAQDCVEFRFVVTRLYALCVFESRCHNCARVEHSRLWRWSIFGSKWPSDLPNHQILAKTSRRKLLLYMRIPSALWFAEVWLHAWCILADLICWAQQQIKTCIDDPHHSGHPLLLKVILWQVLLCFDD